MDQISLDFLWYVEQHRKMWNFLSDNPRKEKEDFGIDVFKYHHCCPACEYNREILKMQDAIPLECKFCFLEWGSAELEYQCERPNSLYYLWDYLSPKQFFNNAEVFYRETYSKEYRQYMTAEQERSRLAKEIANLPLQYEFIIGFLGKEGPSW